MEIQFSVAATPNTYFFILVRDAAVWMKPFTLTLLPEISGTWAHPVMVPWDAMPHIDPQSRPAFFTHNTHDVPLTACLPSGGENPAHWRATRIYQ